LKQIDNEFVTQAKQDIAQASKIVILSHKNPDGDALGSGLALYQFFTELNKTVDFVLPNQLPVYLNWMPNVEQVIPFTEDKEKARLAVTEADLIIMVDFNHPNRLDQLAETVKLNTAKKIMIDHHPDPEDMADITYSRTSSSSTAEMVFEFIASLSEDGIISKPVAECLYVGLMTDTGSFRYNSSNPLTFFVVSQLLATGIDKDRITDRVFNNFSEYRLRLLGHAINQKLVVLPQYATAYIYLSKQDLENFHFEQGDTEGFVNYPLSIKGIVFSAIFIEKDGYTKCSFRSKGNFPANKVSNDHFSGGGHLNAAGGECKKSLTDAIHFFEQILPQYESYIEKDE